MSGPPARSPASPRRFGVKASRGAARTDARSVILATTERLLEERGLDELTVVDVIEAAQVSRASFYMYFESKHAAVAALAETVLSEIVEEIWRPLLSGEEPVREESLLEHWRATLASWSRHQAVLNAAAQGWRSHAAVYDHWGTAFAGYVDELASLIERTRGGAPASPDARTLAAVLVWQHENVLYMAFTGEEPAFADRERLAATLSHVWMRAIVAGT